MILHAEKSHNTLSLSIVAPIEGEVEIESVDNVVGSTVGSTVGSECQWTQCLTMFHMDKL